MEKHKIKCANCGKRNFSCKILYECLGEYTGGVIVPDMKLTMVGVELTCSCGLSWKPRLLNKDLTKCNCGNIPIFCGKCRIRPKKRKRVVKNSWHKKNIEKQEGKK